MFQLVALVVALISILGAWGLYRDALAASEEERQLAGDGPS
ncbi:MAG: hypothetical protein SNJ74_07045 [Fimbriimonadaceae bacterium]